MSRLRKRCQVLAKQVGLVHLTPVSAESAERQADEKRAVEAPETENSGRLFFPVPLPNNRTVARMRFCSHIGEMEYLNCLEELETSSVIKFALQVFGDSPGLLWEHFAHMVLTRTEIDRFRVTEYAQHIAGDDNKDKGKTSADMDIEDDGADVAGGSSAEKGKQSPREQLAEPTREITLPKCDEMKYLGLRSEEDDFNKALQRLKELTVTSEKKMASVGIIPRNPSHDAIDGFVVIKEWLGPELSSK